MLEQERILYGQCVRLMVQGVESFLEHTRPGQRTIDGTKHIIDPPYFFHMFQSDLEDYAEQLQILGILIPIIDPPSRACYFKLACSPVEAEKIAYERAEKGPPLTRMLASLSYFASDKRGMTSEIGEEFASDCYAHSIMPNMCALGYAARKGTGYCWLPKYNEISSIPIFSIPSFLGGS